MKWKNLLKRENKDLIVREFEALIHCPYCKELTRVWFHRTPTITDFFQCPLCRRTIRGDEIIQMHFMHLTNRWIEAYRNMNSFERFVLDLLDFIIDHLKLICIVFIIVLTLYIILKVVF
jgi:hypothetical protein